MVASVCLSTPPACKVFRQASVGDHVEGSSRGVSSCGSSSSAATVFVTLDFGILPNGSGGSNLSVLDSSRALVNSSSKSFLGERRASQQSAHAKMGALGKDFSFARSGPSGLHVPVLKKPRDGAVGRIGIRCLGEQRGCRQWRVRATEDAEQDLLGKGYWDGEEGKQQLNDIEDMKELIAEAENLQSAESAATVGGPGELSPEEIEKQKAERLREELARRAMEQAEQRKQAEIMFGMGQRAYGRGVYDKSVDLLEAALSNIPGSSNLGGEIQVWLAMAYEADNRHSDCIALYKRLEGSHPNKQIRRQAADLRYILEAPKLKISKEEMVSIPIIARDYDRGSKSWSQTIRESRRRKPMPKSKSKDYLEDWLVWDPPRWERNPYFWVAFSVWLTLVGIALIMQ